MTQLTMMCAEFALFGALSVAAGDAASRGAAVWSAALAALAVGNLVLAGNNAAHFSKLVGG